MPSPARIALAALAALLGCAARRAGVPATATAPDPLVARPAFQQCELEGFMALTAARNAILFHDTKESLLAIKSNGPWTRAMIEDLFAKLDSGAIRNHASFGEQKFWECADRERLGIARKPGAAVCLARIDIVFFLSGERARGRTQQDGLERVRAKLSKATPAGLYPDALIAYLAPMVYANPAPDDDLAIRRLVFETCLFPDDFKAWWEGRRREAGGAPPG